MFTNQALMLLSFLLPGFLCMAILDLLTPALKRDNLHRIVNALIFSFIAYAIYSIILKEYPVFLVEKTVGNEKQYWIRFTGYSITPPRTGWMLTGQSMPSIPRSRLRTSVLACWGWKPSWLPDGANPARLRCAPVPTMPVSGHALWIPLTG